MIKDFKDMVARVTLGKNFAWSRWGDGEWECILGYDGGNCDGHHYFPDMKARLRKIVTGPAYNDYEFAIQPKALNDLGPELQGFLKDNDVHRDWGSADLLHDASTRDCLHDLTNGLRNSNRPVLVVGPSTLKSADTLRLFEHYSVAENNCWLVYGGVLHDISKGIKAMGRGSNPVILFSCGMSANVLIHDLWLMYGPHVTLIDAGSVFDPYCEPPILSRRYHEVIAGREQERE